MTVEKFSRMTDDLLIYGGSSSQTATTMQQMQDYMVLQANTVGNLVDSLLWQPTTTYAKGARVHSPNMPAGYMAEATSETGQSGSNEPAWSLDYSSFTDGTVTWKLTKGSSDADGVPIGMILPFSGNGDIPSGFLLCDGASVSRAMYPDLFAVIGTTYGAVDDEHFNLPNLIDKFIEGSSTAGTEYSAGLPNITGTLDTGLVALDTTGQTGTRALNFMYQSISTTKAGGLTGNCARGISFNAKNDNPIYGNSTTVQPPALTMRYIIKAFDGETAESALIDVTQYANELALKVSRAEADYVVDSGASSDGTIWYRKYKSGWLEQGGRYSTTVAQGIDQVTITLPKKFSDTNYSVVGTTINTSSVASMCSLYGTPAPSSFAMGGYGINAGNTISGFRWYACGQGADE